MPRIAQKVALTEKQRQTLLQITLSRTQRQDHIERANIILLCESESNTKISNELKVTQNTVKKWRKRWIKQEMKLIAFDQKEHGIAYIRKILEILSDEQRAGAPCKFTAEQICQFMSLACERPEDSGLPISHWSLNSLVDEILKRGIVESISRSRLAVFLKSGRYKAS
jgi:putative transposase